MEIHVHRPTLSSPWTGSLVGYRAKKAKERYQTGRRKGKGLEGGGGGGLGSPSEIFSTLPSEPVQLPWAGWVPNEEHHHSYQDSPQYCSFSSGRLSLKCNYYGPFYPLLACSGKMKYIVLKKKCAVKCTWFHATMRLVLWKVFLCKTRNNSIDNIIQSFFGYETTQKSQDLIFGVGRKNNKNLFNSLQACRHSFSKENVKSVLS